MVLQGKVCLKRCKDTVYNKLYTEIEFKGRDCKMSCKNCGYNNPDTAKFCIRCGTSLNNLCPKCSHKNLKEALFCAICGIKLGETTTEVSNNTTDIESRQLTILFCDIVGFTSLSENLESEDLHDIVRLYQEACAEAINQFGGYLAKYLGDGLLVYFGYPQAHEDDAERAVRAALLILKAVKELTGSKSKISNPLSIRIGIHTGQVMAGEMGVEGARESRAILGEAPNIAFRLLDVAAPDTIIISSDTYKLLRGTFECKDLGSKTLKGFSSLINVYEVERKSRISNRFDTSTFERLSPFIGREIELELLMERWESAKAGSGQVVMISGEAGIGKSRLVQAFKQQLSEEQFLKVESHCSHYYQNTALHPIIENLNRQFIEIRGDSDDKYSMLENSLRKSGFSPDQFIPLLAPLLSLPIPEKYSSQYQFHELQKRKTMQALLDWSLAVSEEQPILRIFEDMQWVDPSTLDYLELLINHLQGARILLLITFRPDFRVTWKIRSNTTHIALNRLTRNQMDEMIKTMNKDNRLPDTMLTQIISRADGIPLFVEELYKMFSESESINHKWGDRNSEYLSEIPNTLKDSLTARLDKIEGSKDLAQLAATIGREFNYDLIGKVSELKQEELDKKLAELIDNEILLQKGLSPNARYFFKHHLIQDAAYQSMLKTKRQDYHKKIAAILENNFQDTIYTNPELIAIHFTNADEKEQALKYWITAGKRAIERSAYVEAINHLNAGLGILNTIDETEYKQERNLELLTLLGTALRVIKGFGAPEVQSVYEKAHELSKRVSDRSKVLPVLRGLGGYYLARTEFSKAHQIGEESLKLARTLKSTNHLLQAHYILGATSFCMGNFNFAAKQSKEGFSLYNSEHHNSEILLAGQNPGTACLFWESLSLWFLGYPDQALNTANKALELSKKISHYYTMAIIYNLLALMHQLRREHDMVFEFAEKAISLSRERGYELFSNFGQIMKGQALCRRGELSEGISIIEDCYEDYVSTGTEIFSTYWIAYLAEACLNMGQTTKGIKILDKILDPKNNNEETSYLAELYRLKGELVFADSSDNISEAENCVRKAIEVARLQSSKSLELKAFISLTCMLIDQKKRETALVQLSEIYNWFKEGFDTQDLKDAGSLLH